MVRDIIGFVLGLAGGIWMLMNVIHGVRSGRIRHTDSRSNYSLRRQPIKFTFVAALFVAFAAMLLFCAVARALAVWRHWLAV
jgi:hypothetical protein